MRLHEVFDDNERDVYHHTSAEPFDQFKPFRGVIYTAQNPKHAEAGAKVARREHGRPTNTGDPRTMPLKIRGAIAFMDAPPVIKWPKSFRGKDDYYDIDRHEKYLEYLKAWSAPGLTARGLAYARKTLLDYYDAA